VPAAAVELGDGLAAAAEALEVAEAEALALVSAPVTARPWVVLLGLGLELFFEEVVPVALVLGLALDEAEAEGEAEPVAEGDGVELAAGVFGSLSITGRK
jgi:hypothetical protein